MALSLGFRPRSDDERRRLARALARAPRVVGIGFADDGWAAACIAIAGRIPVWACEGDPGPASAVLQRLGLPPLGTDPPEATLDRDLRLRGNRTAASGCLPPVDGPLVTILICTFDRATMLPQAIASALAQSWPCEVVVVDDGSSDGTWEVLQDIDGIRAFHQDNAGKPTALEHGLSQARGEAVLVLDDDDLLLPGAVAVLAKALFEHPDLACVCGDTIVFDGDTGVPERVMPACRNPGALTVDSTLQQIPAMPGAALIRMDAQRAAGAYDPTMIRGQDMDMFLRLARVGPFATVPLPTFLYRAHDGLRGAAGDRWRRSDKSTHDERFFGFVRPVFERRYREASPIGDRAEAFAWVSGLHARGLDDLARAEADRWAPPYSPREAWVLGELGRSVDAVTAGEPLVVVDDGDPGALEALLHADTGDRPLWVDLLVPRDPLGSVRLFWPGSYGAREPLHTWVDASGPWHLRLSSAPRWRPTLPDRRWLPPLDPMSAVWAVAAALDWPEPDRARPGLPLKLHRHAAAVVRANRALRAGQPAAAVGPLADVLEALPDWPGGWALASAVFRALGLDDEARTCAARAA